MDYETEPIGAETKYRDGSETLVIKIAAVFCPIKSCRSRMTFTDYMYKGRIDGRCLEGHYFDVEFTFEDER